MQFVYCVRVVFAKKKLNKMIRDLMMVMAALVADSIYVALPAH